jgi:cob(I)alamin adenosyltransferase
MAIYTKKGDKGKTSLFNNQTKNTRRVSKDSLVIKAIGAVDEVNSYLGVIVSESKDKNLEDILRKIQKNLFTINASLSGAKIDLDKKETINLEKMIDDLEGSLPVLANFILPGGTRVAAKLMYARTLARRAERCTISLKRRKKVNQEVLRYLNRLSDYIFMLARKENYRRGVKWIIWSKKASK